MAFRKKHPTYYIVMRGGRTSRKPFPHPSRQLAEAEAIRLAKAFPGAQFYVFRAEFAVVESNKGLITTQLRFTAEMRSACDKKRNKLEEEIRKTQNV